METAAICAVACVLSFASTENRAASFACERATTEIEKLICSDAELSALDDDLAKEYQQALARSGNRRTVIAAQRQWIAERDACPDRLCVSVAYNARIFALEGVRAADQVNCDPSAGIVDVENCPEVVAPTSSEDLRTTYCVSRPSGDYLNGHRCSPYLTDQLIARTRIIHGDNEFCRSFLKSEYALVDLNLLHNISDADATQYLSLPGANTEIHPRAGRFDINNDGRSEDIGWLKAYSGAGSGCDIERFVQLNAKRTRIANTKLTGLLGGSKCGDNYRAIRYQEKTYLENRRLVHLSEGYYDLVKELVILEGGKRRSVCRFTYRHR